MLHDLPRKTDTFIIFIFVISSKISNFLMKLRITFGPLESTHMNLCINLHVKNSIFSRKIPSEIVVRHRLFQFDDFSHSGLTEVGEHYFCNVVRFGLGGNLTMVLSVFGKPLKEYFAFYSNLQYPF